MSQHTEQIIDNLNLSFIYFFKDLPSSENIMINGSAQFNFCFSLKFSILKLKDNSAFFVKWQQVLGADKQYRDVIMWNAYKEIKDLVSAKRKEIEDQILEEFLRRFPTFANKLNNNVQIMRDSTNNTNTSKESGDSVPLISIQTSNDDLPFDEDDEELFNRMISQEED